MNELKGWPFEPLGDGVEPLEGGPGGGDPCPN